jgi:tetratricopeptide (TPR) repeat protein
MIRKFCTFLCLLGLLAVFLMNYKSLLALGDEHITSRKAEGAISVKNWEKAIDLYEQAYRTHPSNVAIMLRLAWLKTMAKQPEEAAALYREILRKSPGQPQASIQLARQLESDPKHINDAVLILRKALKVNPNDARLLQEAGNIYKTAAENPQETRKDTKKGLYTLALYYYQVSLRFDPQQFSTYFNLGVVNQQMDQDQPAAKAYCQAIILNPHSYEARYNLGMVLSQLNFQEEAYRQLNMSVQTLGENDMQSAQALALKVQTIKNQVYQSSGQGLQALTHPDFLEKGCLLEAKPTDKD